MEQRVSLVTLGVRDLARARAFYEALGWTTGAEPDDDVVFFQAGGMIVALWGRDQLAEDTGVEDSGGWGGVTLAYNARSPAEVDAVIAEAEAAGATIAAPRRRDLLGRLLGRVRRSRGPCLGGRAQPALDARRGRVGQPLRHLPAIDSLAVAIHVRATGSRTTATFSTDTGGFASERDVSTLRLVTPGDGRVGRASRSISRASIRPSTCPFVYVPDTGSRVRAVCS